MKTHSPRTRSQPARRYFHRHYVNAVTPRAMRDTKDSIWTTAGWLGVVVVLTAAIFSVVYVLG